MRIKRDVYLNKLIMRKHNKMVKIITGIRRCGKSYLLFELFANYLLSENIESSHIIKLALDDRANKQYRNPDELYHYVTKQIKDKEMYYILLDEIQLVDEFVDVLNGFTHIENCDVYVTGSNAKFLSKDIVTEFRGRGDQVHMYPLSFFEFYENYSGDKYEAWNEYLQFGGLPYIATINDFTQKREYLEAILYETYINDMIERNHIQNETEFNELINILASSIGSLTNPNKLMNTFKSIKNLTISINTLKSYLNYLEESFIVESATRYDIKGKKYIETPKKYYFMDLGLRNARLNFRQLEETHIMENIIYNELRSRGFNVDVGVVTIHTKDSEGKNIRKQIEVDFVCNKGQEKYYIQSAFRMDSEEKKEQELRSLKAIDDSFKKIVIVKDGYITGKDENGFTIINVFDFLLNKDSLSY